MTRVNFIVEGQTEEVFVRNVLVPYLSTRGVYANARSVQTSRHGNKIYRGGLLDYGRAKADILRWLTQDKDAHVTTMFDLYALPIDFPGFSGASTITDIYKKAEALEKAFAADINMKRFIPYIQLHEFEALLFSGPEVVDEWMGLFAQSGRKAELDAILSTVRTPEHINQGSLTAPSMRLKGIYDAYDKVFIGSGAGEQIGVQRMLSACRHFAKWMCQLVELGA